MKNQRRFALLGVLAILVFEAVGGFFFPGREVFGLSLFPPGGLESRILQRIFHPDFSALVQKAFRPGIWIFLFLLCGLPGMFRFAAFCFFLTQSLECLHIASVFSGEPLPGFLGLLHRGCFFLGVSFLLSGFFQMIRSSFQKRPTAPILSLRVWFGSFFAIFGGFLFLYFLLPKGVQDLKPRAMAHYYSWFPENWKAGFFGDKVSPPLLPALGKYRSGTEEVLHQHALWAKEAGIECFILDWWPSRRWTRDRVLKASQVFQRKEQLCVALLYETLDLRQPHEKLVPGERENIVFLSPERAKAMGEQWVRMVNDYMKDPRYLRWSGKPVLYIYASRHLVGDVAEGMKLARSIVRERTGEELFLVGDEVYFEVPQGSEQEVRLLPTYSPNWNRLRAFDAITAYNTFDNSRPQHGGEQGSESFLRESTELFQKYRSIAASLAQPLLPLTLVAYNDRGHRPQANHFIVPRYLPSGESFLSQSYRRWTEPFLDQSQGLFALTSWNEWNEGSQIEPSMQKEGSFSAPESLGLGIPYTFYAHTQLHELCRLLHSKDPELHCRKWEEK